MSKKEKINCKICGGRYANMPSHKKIHEISNKHTLAVYKLREVEKKLRELREIFEY